MEFLINILKQDKPSEILRNNTEKLFELIPELSVCKNFDQKNIWHIYDVFEHILHVVDGVPNNLILRLAALFHDVGKPFVYKEDENGIGHFWEHWNKSNEIFCEFARKYELEENTQKLISDLILYHDLNIDKISEKELDNLIDILGENGIIMLFKLKRSDLLAQNEEFHYFLEIYNQQEIKILKRIKGSDLNE